MAGYQIAEHERGLLHRQSQIWSLEFRHAHEHRTSRKQ